MDNIFFMETKRNVVIDGNFTKLIYSDASVATNGLYIHAPFLPHNNYKNNNRTTFYISPMNPINVYTMDHICDIEDKLLKKFKHHFGCGKCAIYSLRDQLSALCFKTFHEAGVPNNNHTYILRISGIWETASSVGVTFRFNSVMNVSDPDHAWSHEESGH